MPGHCGILPENILACDVTELDYNDNLLSPQGGISDLEKNIASVYKTEACFLSAFGATNSVYQAIFITKDRGKFLLIGKLHISIFNAMRLFCKEAYHVDEVDENTVIPADVKTAVVTSPDYFGACKNLAVLCDILHKKGIDVLVDASHGSHFIFSDKLPDSATEYADLVIHSLHKTLPVMTAGSALLVKKKEYVAGGILAKKLLHSTSPNHAVICSVEKAFEKADEYPKIYDEMLDAVKEFTEKLPKPFEVVARDDKTRLVVSSPFEGRDVMLAVERAGFVAEMSEENKVVYILTCNNYHALPDLLRAFASLDLSTLTPFEADKKYYTEHKDVTLLTFGGRWQMVPLREAEGKPLYFEVGLYPPGVPLCYSHEVLTAEKIRILEEHPNGRFGLQDGNVFIYTGESE